MLDKISKEAETDSNADNYRNAKSLGYEFARLILESQSKAKLVAPILNVEMSECTVKLDTGLLQLGAASQLLGFTTVFDKLSSSGYSLITETGYIEIGTDIVITTVPGELVPQLIYGNVVTSDESYLGTEWELEPTAEIIRRSNPNKTVLVMGLCNDAIGYIIPDNDFAPFITDTLWALEIGEWKMGEELFGEYHRHYEELLSAGNSSATSVISSLNKLAEKRNTPQ